MIQVCSANWLTQQLFFYMHILQVIVFLSIAIGIIVFFYYRLVALRESRRIMQYFEKLQEQLGLKLQGAASKGQEVFPRLEGQYQGRKLLVERTLREKFKFFVMHASLHNPEQWMLQIVPKNHLRPKESLTTENLILSGIEAFDKEFLLISSQPEWARQVVQERFMPFLAQYEQLRFLFSTLVLYQQGLTLVILSSSKKMKYDLVIGTFVNFLYGLCAETEAKQKAKA